MTTQRIRTSIPFVFDRSFPAQMVVEYAKAVEASGVVDDLYFWDQLTSWWPHVLWKPENSPLANVMKDCDSFSDAFLLSAIAAATTEKIGVAVSTDALRHGPAELMQRMLTLTTATERAILMIGAGEMKQVKPFGYKRSDGLKRLEDIFQAWHMLLENDCPIDFEGELIKLDQAWVGAVRPHKPLIWAMGGGPKLASMGAKYADGFFSATPFVYPTPEQWGAHVKELKEEIEKAGRDPEAFDFAFGATALMHEDHEQIEKAWNNRLVRYSAAIMGRLNQTHWDIEGVEPVMPRNFHYALHLLPAQMTMEELDQMDAKVSMKMMEKSFHYGTPKEVGTELRAYVEAGATEIILFDMLPLTLELEESQAAMGRSLEALSVLRA